MNDTPCFHCGLPITESHPPTLEVRGQQRPFCCPGCEAVCHAIVESGNEDYYHYRETPSRQVDTEHLPEWLKQLKLYDHPDIQRDFVTSNSDGKEASLILEEIRCAACLWLNERHLRQLDGVLDVDMDYTSQRVRVYWDPDKIQLSDILKAISDIGYIAHPYDPRHREKLSEDQKHRSIQRIIFAALFGMAVMNFSIATYFMGGADDNGHYPMWVNIGRWTSLFASGMVLAYPGQTFFRDAWRDLKNRQMGMDVPVALGLLVAWLGSFWSTWTQHGEVYFESIVMFVLFLLIARYTELRARITAAALLDQMAKVIPRTANRLHEGELQEVPVIELQPGDRIQILPGETMPVDSILQQGESSFDESLLTGESLPVSRGPGAFVASGAINGDQSVIAEVEKTSNASTLSQMNKMVDQGLRSRPHYVELADQIAGKFVAAILLIALATLTFWLWRDPNQALHNVIAVLIVTCPCALALAAPVAITLSAARLSSLNILPLRMSALESLATSDTLIFDKTGTLTEGHPTVKDVIPLGTDSEKECLRIAAILEQSSEHPFAKALRAASPKATGNLQQLRNHPGKGLEATYQGLSWKLGKPEFALDPAADTEALQQKLANIRAKGYSVLMLANTNGPQAIISLTDLPREGTSDFLKHLQTSSIQRQVILSGDHNDNVQRLASSLGITQAYGGLSPQDKLAWIQQQQDNGHRVIMIGDGINDAPTLAAADASISFADATHLAQANSDFVMLGSDFRHLAKAFELTQRTRRIILQNLAWAIGYNLLAIPLAAMGYIPPWGAAIGMSLSSFIVVINAMRLRTGHTSEISGGKSILQRN